MKMQSKYAINYVSWFRHRESPDSSQFCDDIQDVPKGFQVHRRYSDSSLLRTESWKVADKVAWRAST